MKPAFILLFVLFTISSALADRDRGLTPVEREACLSFPKITPAESMKEGVHFTRDSVCMSEGYTGNCEIEHDYVVFKYHYLKKSTIEYYTADGRLVTTKKESIKHELGTLVGEYPAEAEKKIIPEIEKKIFNSSEPVCADSFYK